MQNHPELTRIVEAWPTLPERLRDAIAGMMDGTDRGANLRRVVAMLGIASDAYIEALADRMENDPAAATEPPLLVVTDGDEGEGGR